MSELEQHQQTKAADQPAAAGPAQNGTHQDAAAGNPSVPESEVAATARVSAAPELPEGEMSFAEMFELAEKQAREKRKKEKAARGAAGERDLRPGGAVEARVVGVSGDSVFVDLGGKAEGVIAKSELLEEGEEREIKEGETIEARVIGVEGGQVRLGRALGHQSVKNRELVQQAFDTGLPIEGRVTGQNKGGLDIEIGGLRAFCPISQIDLRFTNDAGKYIGQKLQFKVVEYKDRGRNIVVSRRSVLEEEQKKAAEEVISKLVVGKPMTGKVTSLKDYGAFVDLGGIEGLVHVSEISHGRLTKPSDALKVGQDVEVVILKIEDAKPSAEKKEPRGGANAPQKKISLSMKALESDPWQRAQASLHEGQKVSGKVLRIQDFGAFVELMPGVDGLIHVSNMSNTRVGNPRDLLKEGDEVEATIVSVDWGKKRIGLSLVKTPQELAGELGAGKVMEGTIDRIESFGLFVKLPNGARGLVPLPETGTQRGADLKKEFQPGQTVKVSVLETDEKSGKIRLSIKRADEAEERALYKSYMGETAGGKGLGTFGDLFMDRFKQAKK